MLLVFTSIIAICGILYELLIGTLSSYLIGNSVQQFSFTIGFFMSGMWIGAYLSRFFETNVLKNFLRVELMLCVVGASSVIFLKAAYVFLSLYMGIFIGIYFLFTVLIGSFVGFEIPLVARLFKELKIKSHSVISDIFTFDYIGALIASLLFPLFLLPYLGVYNTALFIASLNLIVAINYILYLRKFNIYFNRYFIHIGCIVVYLICLWVFANKIENFYLKFYYREPILQTYQTPYQNIVLTKWGEDFRMYIDGNIQFLSLDEHRYHEALVDWPKKLIRWWENLNVLVLWGGDGLAVRNLLEYEEIKKITLVELDPKMIEISTTQQDMLKLNKGSLLNTRVEIITWDAFTYLVWYTWAKYDFIIADFPDPKDVHTAKLYSEEFYAMIYRTLSESWVFVTQASSSFFATKAFVSITLGINEVFGNSLPYHRYLPSFGDWGFVVAQKWGLVTRDLCGNLGCTSFDADYDLKRSDVKKNTLSSPKIIEYYEEWYKKYNL